MAITGIHHVALNCTGREQFDNAVHFYRDLLGLKPVRSWGGEDNTVLMLDTGSGILEIFSNGKQHLGTGDLKHIALRTDDVDACVAAVRAAGYEITHEPQDVDIPSDPVYPVRTAFCKGAADEIVEFFTEL